MDFFPLFLCLTAICEFSIILILGVMKVILTIFMWFLLVQETRHHLFKIILENQSSHKIYYPYILIINCMFIYMHVHTPVCKSIYLHVYSGGISCVSVPTHCLSSFYLAPPWRAWVHPLDTLPQILIVRSPLSVTSSPDWPSPVPSACPCKRDPPVPWPPL